MVKLIDRLSARVDSVFDAAINWLMRLEDKTNWVISHLVIVVFCIAWVVLLHKLVEHWLG